MRHVIADPIGAPAQPQLGQIARAHHQRALLIGETEQIVGAQARLHILKGHIIDRLAACKGMAQIGQHLARGRADVQLVRGHA